MATKRILIVEDEEHLRNMLRLNLELEGYFVQTADNGKKALLEFRSARYDLLVLDVMLPEMDGYTLCETIRLENTTVPVLFLTAKAGSDDRIKGLKLGADDYLAKPFNLEEFLLRIKILLKRSEKTYHADKTADTYTFGESNINFLTFEITGVQGQRQQLSKREVMLLKLLIDRKGEVVSREQILETVWGVDVYPSTRTIDNYILAFRKYFERDPKEPKHFHSIRGVGYKFTE
ncbi:MAG: response regulator transcription factor [Bacteroidetes bacterium]|nr:response regulator transcription factor [Bacteroidota bacterium]